MIGECELSEPKISTLVLPRAFWLFLHVEIVILLHVARVFDMDANEAGEVGTATLKRSFVVEGQTRHLFVFVRIRLQNRSVRFVVDFQGGLCKYDMKFLQIINLHSLCS